jgi:hypothetical protein
MGKYTDEERGDALEIVGALENLEDTEAEQEAKDQ